MTKESASLKYPQMLKQQCVNASVIAQSAKIFNVCIYAWLSSVWLVATLFQSIPLAPQFRVALEKGVITQSQKWPLPRVIKDFLS